ncbi:MAG: S-methyl-5-thioribose-1-phosphate isomerase [Hyphomonadaceae bacterium]|nr:S-methyl-5-thioribose-1-phosphate isomerase [Clostridia bacterium]
MNTNILNIQSVQLDDEHDTLLILDQTKLPNTHVVLKLKTPDEIWDAIYHLKVRGAPAIGIAAAYGVYLGAKQLDITDVDAFLEAFIKLKHYFACSRPTAVNLFWALDKMQACVNENKHVSVSDIKIALLAVAHQIKDEDALVCKSIGQHGLTLLEKDMGLLTHCNAGQLATAKYGTALAPIYLGYELGYNFKVFADETRPLLQGARLTAHELMAAGVDITLICDNMAATVMKNGWVDAVLVGCDRVAANGDTANKIGTSGVAILAKHYNIPFYVCAPTATIDLQCVTGDDIEIEQRKAEEITEQWYTERMAPAGVKVYNPAFDITDAKLITAIITESGIVRAPYEKTLNGLFE